MKQDLIFHIGRRFNKWTIISEPLRHPKFNGRYYLCECSCGQRSFVKAYSLKKSRSKACMACGRKKHGDCYSRLYHIWQNLKRRCHRKNAWAYHNYGARGIRVCDKWHNYQEFRAWALTNGYSDNLQIDRIDNNRGYFPGNCRWTTREVNQRNTRRNHLVRAFGETKCVVEWSEDKRCKVTKDALFARLTRYGWPAERAITLAPTQ